MEMIRKKPYKARKPEDTIFLIRQILHEKLGIVMREEHFEGAGEFFSCRISFANRSINKLNIGTNGKGMKFEFALASAYGELMERLQNQMLIMHRHTGSINSISQFKESALYQELYQKEIISNFKFAPDEENIVFDKDSTQNCISKFFYSFNIEELEDYYQGKTLSLVPYVNVFEQKIEKLPVNIIFSNCTSNGMCAGNTPYEALIQGMCEILERYVIRLLYYQNLTLPTISMDYFVNTDIYKKIKLIEKKYGWNFEIKDCSCNLGFPAIGILIIDKAKLKYKFHIGVDPSPITALERTITEIYQGKLSLDLTDIDWELQNNLLTDFELKDREMFRTCTVGTGHFPISLLSKTQSYDFKGFDLSWGESDDDDLKLILGIFEKNVIAGLC